ncbi:PREDICTED: uncharacterized protein LOC109242548 [Nicotiana attenuata]|uniref:Uncharacterized protein n=1 Tax=Nicotiana attenuata TaxID=49451 RepID=A0A314L4Y8_NICAT|nr:PREDICTED: uncharacterized protein LOC109242548 [Nicotiana attenuata]OIT36054.1 hypothetical protein A4A49_27796 [Nicotiana attenuata]
MASLQCQKPVAQQTVCQKNTTVTCHKANNEHHSFADKMKEMTGKMFHHENHGQQSACHGSKTQQSACHGSTAMHGAHANYSQQNACHGAKPQQSGCHGSTAMQGSHGNHSQQTACHGSKKEGGFMHKMGDQLKTMRRKKNKDGRCRDGSDSSSSSSSDESDNENCGRNKRESC